MTKYTFAEDQNLHKMTVIVYNLHEHKLQADCKAAKWPLTDAHQCHTLTALSRAYLEEPVHMPSTKTLFGKYSLCHKVCR